MILTKTVKMRWSGNNRNWYEVRGYVFTKYKDEFEVKVEDLSDGSKVKVDIKCDGCGEILTGITWSACKRGVYANDDKHYCHTCIVNVFSAEKSKQTKLKNGKSFYQWCYDNLSKEKAEENFIETKKRDKIKTEYCLSHNIPLLRIKYDQFDNIEQTINNFIQELSTKQQDSSILIAK